MVPQVPSGKAMVVYGRKTRMGGPGYRVFTKGPAPVMPIIESFELLDISPKTIELDLKDVKTGLEGVRANIRVSVTYKVGEQESALLVAAEHILGLPEEDVRAIVRNVMEGTIRTVVRMLDDPGLEGKPYLISDRARPVARTDLLNMGLDVENLTIEHLRTVEGGGD